MKKTKYLVLLLIIIAIIVSFFAANQEKKEYQLEEIKEYKYHVIYIDEKMGVIDEKGNIVVKPEYEFIQLPNPDKAIFICINGEESKVYNEKNEEILKQYSNVLAIPLKLQNQNFEYEKSILKYKKDGKYGLINFDGDVVLKANYDEITALKYKEGELLVKKNDKYGVFNIKGVKITEIKYDEIEGDNFSRNNEFKESGYITCIKNNTGYQYGYINYDGKEILKNEYNEISRIIEINNTSDIYLIARKQRKIWANQKWKGDYRL